MNSGFTFFASVEDELRFYELVSAEDVAFVTSDAEARDEMAAILKRAKEQ